MAADGKGITPIYMGSTGEHNSYNPSTKDHPHIHGEHVNPFILVRFNPGSPPYTWGAPSWKKRSASIMGITPIYMGSTML